MKKYLLVLFLAVPARAASPWSGRLDKTWNPYLSAYQSFTDGRQAIGLEKRVLSLEYNGQEMAKFGVFGGATRDTSAPQASPRVVGGGTFAVPGSLLDFALGTDWGSQWLPKLKTGVTVSYDLVRPNQAHWRPDFYGFGVAYPLGGGN